MDKQRNTTTRRSREHCTATIFLLAAGLALATANACGDESAEPTRVSLPVVVDDGGISPASTDLGYTVEVQTLRMSIVNLELTTAGETHASVERSWLEELIIPSAYAHPGHYAGGDVIGELRGRWIVDWLADDGVLLGDATLLTGDYNGANFTFGEAGLDDGLDASDVLVGHNVEIAGTARRDGSAVSFHALVDQDAGRQLVGAPFELIVTGGTDVTIGLQCFLTDPVEGDTLFDGIDFFALDDGSGQLELEADSPDYNRLRRGLQSHDHYNISVR